MTLPELQKNYCRFYVVRHAESEANAGKFMAGHLDAKLTEQGIEQAAQRAAHLKHVPFADAFASDLLRAKYTAEIISKEHQLIVKTKQILREKFYGKYEGTSYEDFTNEMKSLMQEYESLLEEERSKHRLGGEIESDYEINQRMVLFFRETALAYPGKNVLVVSHGGVMREFLIQVGFANRKELGPGFVKNTGYFVLDSDGIDFFIRHTEGIEKK